MTTLTFFASGIPKGQPRPRAFARKFGDKWQARVYDAGTAENWKSQIALAVKPHLPPQPLAGPISLTATFNMPRPKGHTRKDGSLKPDAPGYHIIKPDSDNLEKALMDALTQCGVWGDDSQVCVKSIRKVYGVNGHTGAAVTIHQLEALHG
jgi:Holliday junction resolvase RusA-like endonuclease